MRAREALLGVLWAQWTALGALGAHQRTTRTLIDPEALLLASLSLREEERRLDDVLLWWAQGGSTYLSTGRVSALAHRFPDADVGAFAAAAAARDPRWTRLRGDAPAVQGRPSKGGTLRLETPPALWLRLRTLLGVGVKADVAARLLSGGAATVSEAAAALDYTASALRSALADLSDGGWVDGAGRPRRYHIDAAAWAALLGQEVPAWHPWAATLSALLDVARWSGAHALSDAYVAATYGWDLAERHAGALESLGVRVKRPRARDAEAFTTTLLALLHTWIDQVEGL